MRERVLITGGARLLGSHLIATQPPDADVYTTQWHRPVAFHAVYKADLAVRSDVSGVFARIAPTIVIHTAYSRVEGRRNIVDATHHVVEECQRSGATLVHMSTDLVFDGLRGTPYAETDEPCPIEQYGRWKANADAIVTAASPNNTIVRTSLITAIDPLDPNSSWVAETIARGEEVRLFVDELRNPISADGLARQVWEVAFLPLEERKGT